MHAPICLVKITNTETELHALSGVPQQEARGYFLAKTLPVSHRDFSKGTMPMPMPMPKLQEEKMLQLLQ